MVRSFRFGPARFLGVMGIATGVALDDNHVNTFPISIIASRIGAVEMTPPHAIDLQTSVNLHAATIRHDTGGKCRYYMQQ